MTAGSIGMDITGAAEQELILPPLRNDIDLYKGPHKPDGSPTWTLHDPVRNQFFRIGWLEFEILMRWKLENVNKIVAQVNTDTTLHISEDDIAALLKFLANSHLLEIKGKQAIDSLCEHVGRLKQNFSMWLIKNYLFIRIPLVRPDRFLGWLSEKTRFIFSRSFVLLTIVVALVGVYLVSRQWDTFNNTFLYFFSVEGLVLFGIAILFSKVIHELGHAVTAKRYGLKIPTMGLAFLVLWPVLYTDTSEAWKLADRRKRLTIAMAGMTAELALAVYATFIWNFLPDGALRGAVFMVATSTWLLTLLVNANPFMRFDGYYLLSDLLEVQNLQDRSFSLGKWKLRNVLLGLNSPCPEIVSDRMRKILIAYAYSTWIYRFLLFLGIALLVYYMFFKVAGIILMLTEVIWFIARPVYRELRVWFDLRDQIHWNGHSRLSLLFLIIVIALLVVPWNKGIEAPAILKSNKYSRIYPSSEAKVSAVLVSKNEQVKEGQTLVILESPELEFKKKQAEYNVAILRQKIQRRSSSADYLEHSLVTEQQLTKALTEYNGYVNQTEQLRITAPMDGEVVYIEDHLTTGRWLNEKTLLISLNAKQHQIVEAYVQEEDLGRIEPGISGKFYPDNMQFTPEDLVLKTIDMANTSSLNEPYLASEYGGRIGVRVNKNGELIPSESIYRITLDPVDLEKNINQITRGIVMIEGKAESILYRIWKLTGGVLVRESGF